MSSETNSSVVGPRVFVKRLHVSFSRVSSIYACVDPVAMLQTSSLQSSIFAILMLFSLLQTPNPVETAGIDPIASLTEPLIPLVLACGSSRVWKVRRFEGRVEVDHTVLIALLSLKRSETLPVMRSRGSLLRRECHNFAWTCCPSSSRSCPCLTRTR